MLKCILPQLWPISLRSQEKKCYVAISRFYLCQLILNLLIYMFIVDLVL